MDQTKEIPADNGWKATAFDKVLDVVREALPGDSGISREEAFSRIVRIVDVAPWERNTQEDRPEK